MNILEAILIFDILIILYEILISIFSAFYELSGLTKDEARFQVTSLLTGTGFTTTESEKMLKTKKLKRITRDIMIISYIFNITIISTLVSIFTNTKSINLEHLLIGLVISVIVIVILVLCKKIKVIRNFVDNLFVNIVKIVFNKMKD